VRLVAFKSFLSHFDSPVLLNFVFSFNYSTAGHEFFLEPMTGIEPVTSSLPRTCSTN
jgi:hypothetical protein